jgi:hypothetical protein
MSKARAVFSRKKYTPNETTDTPSGFFPQPAPPTLESENIAQIARDVMNVEGLAGDVMVNPWAGGFYVMFSAKGKERTVYLFSLKNERANRDMMKQAVRDLKSVLKP